MAGCGYVCPQCEGKGFTETGDACDWCSKPEISDENWIKEVHEGKCCADD